MATANRVFWETVTVIALLLAIFAVWTGSRWMAKRQIAEAEAEQESALATRQMELDEEAAALQETAEGWAEQLALSEAEAVFHSFAAGIHYASAQRWGRVLGDARDRFVRVPNVRFAHLMTPGGRPIFTTDESVFQTGRIDDYGQWAMESERLRTRPAQEDGVTELAGPVAGGTVLWIAYDTAAAMRTGRPTALGGAPAPAEAP